MSNLLDGLQYRLVKTQLPSWKPDENYGDWQDCDDCTSFPPGTQFRVAPKFVYTVTFNGRTDVATTTDKNHAMSRVAKLVDDGFSVQISKDEATTPTVSQWLADNKIQYKVGDQASWVIGTHFSGGAHTNVKFRKRPDNYWQVSIKNGIAQSELNFDDVDDLEKYLIRQIRTSENNIFITRRSYGTILSL